MNLDILLDAYQTLITLAIHVLHTHAFLGLLDMTMNGSPHRLKRILLCIDNKLELLPRVIMHGTLHRRLIA